jgi:anthranilate synthase component 2
MNELCNRPQATQTQLGGLFFLGVRMANLLVIDNYDSFTYNLVQMFMQYDLRIAVHRSDRISVPEAVRLAPDFLLISPGPRDPAHAGVSLEMIGAFTGKIPILGVCLGMQCINAYFGGRTVRAPLPMHGKTSTIRHEGRGIFAGIPSPLRAARYHSLVTRPHPQALAATLRISAWSDDDQIMALSHQQHPLFGVQFHPESFLTEHGFAMLENFLQSGASPRPQRTRNLEHAAA